MGRTIRLGRWVDVDDMSFLIGPPSFTGFIKAMDEVNEVMGVEQPKEEQQEKKDMLDPDAVSNEDLEKMQRGESVTLVEQTIDERTKEEKVRDGLRVAAVSGVLLIDRIKDWKGVYLDEAQTQKAPCNPENISALLGDDPQLLRKINEAYAEKTSVDEKN
jgi:hypothetical protein